MNSVHICLHKEKYNNRLKWTCPQWQRYNLLTDCFNTSHVASKSILFKTFHLNINDSVAIILIFSAFEGQYQGWYDHRRTTKTHRKVSEIDR